MTRRTVLVNRCRPNESIYSYPDNAVYTTKYSYLTFLPKFLFEQFSRYANLFFLGIAILQQCPNLSPVSKWGTTFSLGFILLLTMVKELSEDRRRRQADDRANTAKSEVYVKHKDAFEHREWKDIKVGDIVRVNNNEPFPADLVLLHSALEDQLCYVETANVDGETNLKARVSPLTWGKVELGELTGIIICDPPDNRVHDFEGIMLIREREMTLGPSNILLRGSQLRNTPWILGVAVYTGRDTKVVQSSRSTRIKRSSVDLMTDRQISWLILLLLVIALVCKAIFYYVSRIYAEKLWYVVSIKDAITIKGLVIEFLSAIVLINNIVPISLVMTLEVIRVYQGRLINNDMELYCPETDTPAVAKTTSLVEELGQVQYIVSDKTGTLTRNEMVLRSICVGGQQYDDVCALLEKRNIPGLAFLLEMMASCNGVVLEHESDGSLTYQSSSPDEVALVTAATLLGTQLSERKTISLTLAHGYARPIRHTFEILAVLEFSSARKRMSIILRREDGTIVLFCKGADSIVWARLAAEQDPTLLDRTNQAIARMSVLGLRTLVFAYRELAEEQYVRWSETWTAAQRDPKDRSAAMAKAMDLVESELILAGVTGVEDRLQARVAETIEKLQMASIKFWVLTGDKLETAVNIGYSCRLLYPGTKLLQISKGRGVEDLLIHFQHELDELHASSTCNAAIILESAALEAILQSHSLQNVFIKLARRCLTVICCRVSPMQKARVVDLIQSKESAVCLAIGDGANDVGMIQAARIGVGISGKEGLQAARSADFSIAQFCFLQRLLLVHGSWGYHRISKAAVYCVYKNILLYSCQVWFHAISLFSGQTLFESWMISLYNILFTVCPPIIIGLTDQYVTAKYLIAHPSLYRFGQNNAFYKARSFWQSALNGFVQSLLGFSLVVLMMRNSPVLASGAQINLFFMGSTLYAGLILTGMLKAALLINYWTWFAIFGLLVCPLSWFLYVLLYDFAARAFSYPTSMLELLGMPYALFNSAIFLFTILLIPLVCLLRDFVWKFYRRQFLPREYHIIQELQREERLRQSRFDSVPIANRFEELHKLRATRRAAWEASQSQKPTEFVGTCLDMCPEYERHEREAHFDVAPFEALSAAGTGDSMVGGSGAITTRIDHSRAVKKYHRPAAGNEVPLPEDVRPPPVLQRTMDYLLEEILDASNAPFSEKHKFVRDRTRSIRQDIIVQQRAIQAHPEWILQVVRLHEEIARFHILSGHRLCELDFADFDPFQNTEQLRKVLHSLQEYYTDIRGILASPGGEGSSFLVEALANEAEFRAYLLLTHTEDQEVFRRALAFPSEVFLAPHVQFAISCVAAFHQADYVGYFRMALSADYLQACLLHSHFTKLRRTALQIMSKSFASRDGLPTRDVARWLAIETLEELAELVEEFGGRLGEGEDAAVYLVSGEDVMMSPLLNHSTLLESTSPATQVKARMVRSIEGKVEGLPLSAIIRTARLALARLAPSAPTAAFPLKTAPLLGAVASSRRNVQAERDRIASMMTDGLLEWVKSTSLLQISTEAMAAETQNRQRRKGWIVSRVSNLALNQIFLDLLRAQCADVIQARRQEMIAAQYRTELILTLSQQMSENIIREMVKKECRAAARSLLRPGAVYAESTSNLLLLDSGLSTPRSKMRKIHASSVFLPHSTPIRYHLFVLCQGRPVCVDLRTTDQLVFRRNALPDRANALSKITLQEKSESEKFDELLKRAINS